MTPPSILILWDIDRTLLDAGPVGREMYAAAFELVTGRPLGVLADMAGRTERAILADMLRRNNVLDGEPAFDAYFEALGDAASRLERRMCETGAPLPGAQEAVAGLVADGTVQSVVTGNIRSVAAIKLGAFDLARHLDLAVGGYGDADGDRAVLVRLAVERAEGKYGVTFAPDRVVVIGDTPHDVKGARDAGVRAVGVATGTSTVEELAAVGADAVLADLTDVAALRVAVFGGLPAEH